MDGVLYNERSWKNMFVNAGYWLISLALMGGTIDLMNHLSKASAFSTFGTPTIML